MTPEVCWKMLALMRQSNYRELIPDHQCLPKSQMDSSGALLSCKINVSLERMVENMETALFESLVLVLIGGIAAIIIHLVFLYLKKQADLTDTRMDDLIVHSLGAPLVMLAFFIPLYLAIQHAVPVYPQYLWIAESKFLTSLYILIAAWIVATFVDGFLKTYGIALAEKTDTDLDDRIISILQTIAKYIIWFTGLLFVFQNLEINITPLIAGAGIIGIAIALAAQDVFSNLFGSAVIVVDQPFKVGDRVLINEILGDVLHIGPRSTRVITLDSDIVTIPNTKIATSVVHNYSLPNPQGRIQVPVTVSSEADIAQVKGVLGGITDEATKTRTDVFAHDPKPTVYLTKMENATMTFVVTVYANGFLYNSIIQDYLNTRIVEQFRKEGIVLV
jgi:MscS family membrane protein